MTFDTGFVSRFFSASDGLRLHARDYGPLASPALPVVCLPGFARTAADFHEVALALSQDEAKPRRVLAADYRGRGLSAYDSNWKNYDIRVELDDLLQVLVAAGIDRAVFIGTSRGGLLTMALAAARPAVIKGVVFNDVGPVIDARGLLRCVGAQAQHAAAAAAAPVDQRHHPGLADAGVDLVHTADLERFHHAAAGVDLLEAELGVGVQVAPQRGKFRVESRDVRERTAVGTDAGVLHRQCPPAFSTRRRGSTAK